MVQLSHPYTTTGKTIALTIQIFVSKVMSLLFDTRQVAMYIFKKKWRGGVWCHWRWTWLLERSMLGRASLKREPLHRGQGSGESPVAIWGQGIPGGGLGQLKAGEPYLWSIRGPAWRQYGWIGRNNGVSGSQDGAKESGTPLGVRTLGCVGGTQTDMRWSTWAAY